MIAVGAIVAIIGAGVSAYSQIRQGQKAEAVRHYEEAIRLRPDYPAANFNLAVVYLEAGDYARALAHAQNCMRGDPRYPRAAELGQDIQRALRGQ